MQPLPRRAKTAPLDERLGTRVHRIEFLYVFGNARLRHHGKRSQIRVDTVRTTPEDRKRSVKDTPRTGIDYAEASLSGLPRFQGNKAS